MQPFGYNRHGPRIDDDDDDDDDDYTDAGKACAGKFRMWGVAVPLSVGELDPNLTQCGQGRGLPARHVSS